jgi:surface protein
METIYLLEHPILHKYLMKVLDYNSFINQGRQKVQSVNEHLWSGIIHRSETGLERKEDMVKSKEELIKKIQEIIDKTHPKEGDTIDLNLISVSNITDMDNLFEKFRSYNFNVSKWDVSKVTTMSDTFNGCKYFDCDLSSWNVSNVSHTDGMFVNCKNFNSDLSKWDVSKINQCDYMFKSCKSFNSDLSKWKINATSLNYMFSLCKNLDCDFSQWNLSKVDYDGKIAMFFGCDSLNDKKLPKGYNKSYRVWTYDINVYDMIEHIIRTETIKHNPRVPRLQLDGIYTSLTKWYEDECSIKKLTISAVYDYYGDPDDEDEDPDNEYRIVDRDYIKYDESTCSKLYQQFVTDFVNTNKYFITNRIFFHQDDFYSYMKDYINDIFQEVDKSDFDN